MAQDAKEFRFQTPEFEGVKKTLTVCSSDLMKVQMQIVKDGGENNLHTHTGDDAFWYVVSGAVKFYGEGDKLIGEYQKGRRDLDPTRLQVLVRKRLKRSPRDSSASRPKTKWSTTNALISRRKKIGWFSRTRSARGNSRRDF
jgi:hypothetical protein